MMTSSLIQKPTDVPLTPGPDDSVSKLEFSPTADFLAVGSWDSQCRIYQIDSATGTSAPKAAIQHDGPVLGLAWSKDGTKVFTCSTDQKAKVFDLNSPGSQPMQIAQHDGPISCMRYLDISSGAGMPPGIVVTGSWDKTVRYWDLRQSQPIFTLQAKERVHLMDSVNDLLVFGTADRNIHVVKLAQPHVIRNTIVSPLKMQTRSLACFPTATGYAVGSIEGRIGIQNTEEKDAAQNFSFKCHRQEPPSSTQSRLVSQQGGQETNIYAVNAISFNRMHGTFSTAGADGTLSFWDKDQRTRLKSYTTKELGNGNPDANPPVPPTPIVSTCFNKDSNLFAYAFSYDWSKGYYGAVPTIQTKVMLHQVAPEEIKPKAKAGK